MTLTGLHFIGSSQTGADNHFRAVNPENGELLSPEFAEGTAADVHQAAELAHQAFTEFRNTSQHKRAELLDHIADEIIKLGDTLVQLVMQESGLPEARILGERGRTCGQIGMFAGLLREGSWVNAVIDHADPGRAPLPKPDTRSVEMALGPVSVFGASNFPLAFSVAGGDTVSALAAGCPVVVKAHPSHPGTSELIGGAVKRAVEKSGLHPGVFSLIQGSSHEVGEAMVKHPRIKAVGFTGSLKAGRHLYNLATSRPEPIPFFGELGSVNPVFLLNQTIRSGSHSDFVSGYLSSLTLGGGQFCTNPGLLILQDSEHLQELEKEISRQVKNLPSATLLNKGIQQSALKGVEQWQNDPLIEAIELGETDSGFCKMKPSVLKVKACDFVSSPSLQEEVFGPAGLLIVCENPSEMLSVAHALSGQLTATIHCDESTDSRVEQLLQILSQKAGRVLFNGYPTGVEVCHSMVHGGPYPASTDSRSTSVGSQAIHRFTRSVCFQDAPQNLLPDELKDGNPLGIYRKIDGKFQRD